ncbi:GNAT family N-acetyltransferase [Pseudoduganella sp. UC29_71]|uniref:GNAT family N-acetyltransferase n=1 Tax=Pseudoduganella sp. UC29_71 TaxID=3350174 RepID=UPI0036718B04
MVEFDFAALRNPEMLLLHLRHEPESVPAIAQALTGLRGKTATIDGQAQCAWHAVFNQIQATGQHRRRGEATLHTLAVLAAEMNLWRNAAGLFFQLLQLEQEALVRSALQFNLGVAYLHCGAYRAAARYLHRAAAVPYIDVKQSPARSRLLRLAELSSQCRALLGSQRIRLAEGSAAVTASPCALSATLFGSHHALALWRLQRDPELARRAGVDCLSSIAAAEIWIGDARAHQTVLAIMHPVCGLIGVAALLVPLLEIMHNAGAARFYFWIGSDFQGQGFGTQAMELLYLVALRQGIRHLFSTVHVDNLGSRRVLEKCGGRALAFGLMGARPGHCFFHVGDDQGDAALHACLAELLAANQANEQLLPYMAERRDQHPDAADGVPC